MLVDIALWDMATFHSSTPKNVMVMARNIEEDTDFLYVSYDLTLPGGNDNSLWVLADDYEREEVHRVKLPYANFIWKWQDLLAGKEPLSPQHVYALRLKAPTDSILGCSY